MKKFIIKIAPYIFGIIALYAILGSFADGNVDDNYRHFAVEKPSNIILGDSRGSQAVVPSILDTKLSKKFDNFSLNIVHSPYGDVYYQALQKKINPETKNGIFILTVDPWNLSINSNIKNLEEFPENMSPLKSMRFYDMSPNYEYLLKNYSRSWFKIYLEREGKERSNTYLHKDGWLEVTVDMHKDSVQNRIQQKEIFYKQLAKDQVLSSERLKSFEDIINFLQKHGVVYIVRIPASEGIMNVENEKFPQFNFHMKKIAATKKIRYFDFSNNGKAYSYTDGNHMYKESSKIFTAQIADSILLERKNLK